jgi:3-deoxy-manno-octulosonate cytidylyltransferase (CMP-KDO synthetase)
MSQSKKLNIIGCIPARYASSRLPGKPLVDIAGKPMILHVVERAKQSLTLTDVTVLTDDQRIFDVVNDAGHNVSMTSTTCASGPHWSLSAPAVRAEKSSAGAMSCWA